MRKKEEISKRVELFYKLSENKTLLFDGAMGTEIEKRFDIGKSSVNKCKTCSISDNNSFEKIINSNIIKVNIENKELNNKILCNEQLNLYYPDIIKDIHLRYIDAGADIIETNTFGASKIVLAEYGLEKQTYLINKKAAEIAVECTDIALNKYNKVIFVSGSIGPGSKLPSLQQIDYETMFESYVKQIEGLIDGGVDILQIETSQDILQAKIAYNAAKSVMEKKEIKLPVFVQLTFEKNGKMLLGSDPDSVINAFYDLDIYALGVNCGVGPKQLFGVLSHFDRNSPFKLVIIPNAGLPVIENGKVKYDMDSSEYAEVMKQLTGKYKIDFIGGCCGTDPEYIEKLRDILYKKVTKKNETLKTNTIIINEYFKNYNKTGLNKFLNDNVDNKTDHSKNFSGFSSLYSYQEIKIDIPPLIIAERVNATGSKKIKEALLSDDFNTIIDIALQQQELGAHLLDVNLAYASKNELNTLKKVFNQFVKNLKIPLSIDTTSIEVIEYVLRNYPGTVLVNSMSFENFEKGVEILRLVKKYGAKVICLTIDEKGLAYTLERKIKIAKRIYDVAIEEIGLKPYQLFFDPLTFSIAAEDDKGVNLLVETLNAIETIKNICKGSFTSLGVSNVSYGLPPKLRKDINSVFLNLAIKKRLDAAIISASKIKSINSIPERNLKLIIDSIYDLKKRKKNINQLIDIYESLKEKVEINEQYSEEEQLKNCIINGKKKNLDEILNKNIFKNGAKSTLNILLEAMKEVGELFENGKLYLPFVLRSAEVMKYTVNMLKPFLKEGDCKDSSDDNDYDDNQNDINKIKTILLATVKGDIHDIGKNLVSIILENNGVNVIDLGVNVDSNQIVASLRNKKIDFIGLSGLLVKSAFEMKDTLINLKENGINIPVLCGGAALNNSYVENELASVYKGKVFYAKDAFSAMDIIFKREKV